MLDREATNAELVIALNSVLSEIREMRASMRTMEVEIAASRAYGRSLTKQFYTVMGFFGLTLVASIPILLRYFV